MSASANGLRWLGLAALAIVLDQITKLAVVAKLAPYYQDVIAVTSFFNLVHVHNTGAAFSLFADQGGWQKMFFLTVALVASQVSSPGCCASRAVASSIAPARWRSSWAVPWATSSTGWPMAIPSTSSISMPVAGTGRPSTSPFGDHPGCAAADPGRPASRPQGCGMSGICPGDRVTLHYRLVCGGQQIVSTFDAAPRPSVGSGDIDPRLEWLLRPGSGHHETWQLDPEQAFGRHNPDMIKRLPRAQFPPGMEPDPEHQVDFPCPTARR